MTDAYPTRNRSQDTDRAASNPDASIVSEHGAPSPESRLGPKLWILAGLVALLGLIAVTSG